VCCDTVGDDDLASARTPAFVLAIERTPQTRGVNGKITEMKMRLIKDALKATGQGLALSCPARRLIEFGCVTGGPAELVVTALAHVCTGTPVRYLGCRMVPVEL